MSNGPEKLESFVHQLVRDQPLRRAPATLEARVLAQLALQQTPMRWWRRGFTQWPLAARVAFLIASYGFVRLAFAGVMSIITFVSSREAAGTAISWVHAGATAVSATASLCSLIVSAIPPLWLYGAAVCGFALYALLFGLGTVAYRTLYVQR
ncbi:MAG: hypothetical protein ACJ8R9_10425 [Steroidobacteraceae bacterium]